MNVIQNPSPSFIRTREGDRTVGHDSKEAKENPQPSGTNAKLLSEPKAHINFFSLFDRRQKEVLVLLNLGHLFGLFLLPLLFFQLFWKM